MKWLKSLYSKVFGPRHLHIEHRLVPGLCGHEVCTCTMICWHCERLKHPVSATVIHESIDRFEEREQNL